MGFAQGESASQRQEAADAILGEKIRIYGLEPEVRKLLTAKEKARSEEAERKADKNKPWISTAPR